VGDFFGVILRQFLLKISILKEKYNSHSHSKYFSRNASRVTLTLIEIKNYKKVDYSSASHDKKNFVFFWFLYDFDVLQDSPFLCVGTLLVIHPLHAKHTHQKHIYLELMCVCGCVVNLDTKNYQNFPLCVYCAPPLLFLVTTTAGKVGRMCARIRFAKKARFFLK